MINFFSPQWTLLQQVISINDTLGVKQILLQTILKNTFYSEFSGDWFLNPLIAIRWVYNFFAIHYFIFAFREGAMAQRCKTLSAVRSGTNSLTRQCELLGYSSLFKDGKAKIHSWTTKQCWIHVPIRLVSFPYCFTFLSWLFCITCYLYLLVSISTSVSSFRKSAIHTMWSICRVRVGANCIVCGKQGNILRFFLIPLLLNYIINW